MKNQISSSDNVIDSRDVIERIEELESEREDLESEDQKHEWDESSDGEELLALLAFAEEAEGYSGDWRYGAQLINDDYFVQYARDLAEDIGAVSRDATWPHNYVDWDAAAEALKVDYSAVDFDGTTFWVR